MCSHLFNNNNNGDVAQNCGVSVVFYNTMIFYYFTISTFTPFGALTSVLILPSAPLR